MNPVTPEIYYSQALRPLREPITTKGRAFYDISHIDSKCVDIQRI